MGLGRNVEQPQASGKGCPSPLPLVSACCHPPQYVGPSSTLSAPSRCSYKQFRSEDTLRINLGLHMNLVSSLLLLNLAFLLSSGLSSRAPLGLCSALGGLTHYCLLCCFTWTALEGCHLYLLFIKVLGTYIHHYLLKLCIVGWGEHRLLGSEGACGLQPEGTGLCGVMGACRDREL